MTRSIAEIAAQLQGYDPQAVSADGVGEFLSRLVAPVAIEYTGQILPGARPCDLSVVWNEKEGDPSTLFLTGDQALWLLQDANAVLDAIAEGD